MTSCGENPRQGIDTHKRCLPTNVDRTQLLTSRGEALQGGGRLRGFFSTFWKGSENMEQQRGAQLGHWAAEVRR